jgi:integrase
MVWTGEQAGQFLDAIEDQRPYALFHLAVYTGMRRNEICELRWSETDLASCQIHVREDVKSEDSNRVIVIDPGTAEVLLDWQGRQILERAEWGDGWIDTGHVFTREDGRPVQSGWVPERFRTLAARSGLPPVTFHGLRHGSATMLLAAGVPIKVISERLGHATSAFTSDVYTNVATELEKAAAAAIAAYVPRKGAMRISNESSGDKR